MAENKIFYKAKEFYPPPDEFPVVREPDFAAIDEDFGSSAAGAPAAEFPSPAPELILPGAYIHEPSSSGGRRKKLIFYISALAMLLLCILGGGHMLWRGEKAQADIPEPEVAETAAEPAEKGEAGEPAPESGTKENTPAPSSENNAATAPEPEQKEEPSCELVYIAFSAQQLGKVLFKGSDGIISARLDIYDPLTDSLEYTYDIPREAIDEGEYVIEPFWTEEIYERHRAEYDAASSFPETTKATVTMEYKTESGTETMTASSYSAPEQGWSLSYWSEDTPANDWNHPGCFALRSYESYEPLKVVYNEPDKVGPGVISVLMEADGRPFETLYSESTSEKEEGYTYYNSSGKEVDLTFYYASLVIPRPASLKEGEGRSAHFYVTQYLENYDMLYTTELDVDY